MRDVIDQLESYQAHLDTLYPGVSVGELDRNALEFPGGRRRWPNPRMLRALAFAAGFAVMAIVGLVVFVVGDQTDPEVAATVPTSGTPTTSVTAPTTTSEPPPLTMPTASVPETTLATVPPAAPIAGFGNNLNAAFDQSGRLVLSYWSADETAAKVVICADPQCVSRREVVLEPPIPPAPIEGQIEPSGIDMALGPDGTPIIVESRPEWNSPTVYACADPACSAVTSADFAVSADFPQVAIGRDGLPRIAYFDRFSNPRQLKLAICGDAACGAQAREIVTLDPSIGSSGDLSLEIDAAGRVSVGYESGDTDATMQARVATCQDVDCGDPDIVSIDDAVAPRVVASPSGGAQIWYRSGPLYVGEGDLDVAVMLDAWQLMVMDCDIDRCGEPVAVDVGWGVLMSWPGDVMQTGDAEFLIASAYWSPFHCSPVIDVTAVDLSGIEPVAVTTTFSNSGWEAALVTLDGSPALVHDTGDGGLAIVEITPSASGTTVREQC